MLIEIIKTLRVAGRIGTRLQMNEEYGVSHMPDVLSCLADLSNDEIFTPPAIANQMLDLLPAEIWTRDDVRFLDPCCKTGVFLREITKRLLRGQMPDFDRRMSEIDRKRQEGEELNNRDTGYLAYLQATLEHILKHQVYGIAITGLTAMMTRRTLYCARQADSEFSVVKFDTAQETTRVLIPRVVFISIATWFRGCILTAYSASGVHSVLQRILRRNSSWVISPARSRSPSKRRFATVMHPPSIWVTLTI